MNPPLDTITRITPNMWALDRRSIGRRGEVMRRYDLRTLSIVTDSNPAGGTWFESFHTSQQRG